MSFCEPGPVQIPQAGIHALFDLDNLVGLQSADKIRAWLGLSPRDRGPYGYVTDMCDGYLASSLSSGAAFSVFLVMVLAGLIVISHRRISLWLLAGTATVSLLDTLLRTVQVGQRKPQIADMLLPALPLQLLANALFQFVVPFALGIGLSAMALVAKSSMLWFSRRRHSRAN